MRRRLVSSRIPWSGGGCPRTRAAAPCFFEAPRSRGVCPRLRAVAPRFSKNLPGPERLSADTCGVALFLQGSPAPETAAAETCGSALLFQGPPGPGVAFRRFVRRRPHSRDGCRGHVRRRLASLRLPCSSRRLSADSCGVASTFQGPPGPTSPSPRRRAALPCLAKGADCPVRGEWRRPRGEGGRSPPRGRVGFAGPGGEGGR